LRHFQISKLLTLILFLALNSIAWVQTYTSNGTFSNASNGTLVIECWGGGGGGGGAKQNGSNITYRAGGGGGGAYSKVTITYNANTTLNINVGSGGSKGSNTGGDGGPGSESNVKNGATTLCSAAGGGGGGGVTTNSYGAGGSGGSSGVGYLYSGGNGVTPSSANTCSGGGGGGGGSTAVGSNGSNCTGGNGGNGNGGKGGDGNTGSSNGTNASATGYGGGGGGGRRSGTGTSGSTGGDGRQGYVVLTFTACTNPSITVNPTNQNACGDNSVTFSITATGASSYQWEYSTNPAGTWYNIPDGSWGTTGSLTSSITFNNPETNAWDNYLVRCKAISGGCTTTSSNALLRVYSLPSNPSNPTSNSPQCASPGVTLTRSGTPPAAETWYWQTSANGTSTASSASTYNVTSSGTYYIRKQNNTSLCWSSGAGSLAVTVNTAPAAPTSPVNYTGCAGIAAMSVSVPFTSLVDWYTDVALTNSAYQANATGTVSYSPTLSSSQTYYVTRTVAATGCRGPATTVTATVNPLPVLNGVTVSSNCWKADNATDYSITISATGTSPTSFDGSTYGMLALINIQGTHVGQYGGYFAWNSTTAQLNTIGYTKNQMACTGGGFVGMYNPASGETYGADKATIISASTSVSGNTRTVTFVVRPNTNFPILSGNSISQYASSTNGCDAGWTETANLFNSSPTPTAPTVGSVTHPTCSVATGTFQINSYDAARTYTFTPAGVSISGSGLVTAPANSYTFTIDNAAGCTSTSTSVTVSAQPSTPSAPTIGTITQPTCATATASIALSGLPASGSWTVTASPGGSTITGNNSSTGSFSGLAANNTYTFTVTNASGCTSVASANAVVNAQPATPDAPSSVTSATTICHGNSVNLNATSADNTINWYTVETNGSAIQTGVGSTANHSVSPTTNTTYYAEAQNGSGCKSSRTATGLITVENPVSAINTAIGTTLQTNDYVWVGQTDAVWATVNNWRQFDGTNLIAAGSAPGSNNTNRIYVVQNSTSSNCIFNASNLSVGSTLGVTSFLVGTGTSLNLNGQNLNLTGNITINGTFIPGSGTITLSGSANQTIDGSSALSFSNVTINKTGGTLTAAKDMTITGALTLTNGILDMNSKTLTIGMSSANGTITGGSASSYILALDGTTPSKLIHRVNSTTNETYRFPIGTGSVYTPVTVVMTGGTLSNASIQVWTKNSKVTGMSNDMSCYLNRSWFVEPTGTITNPAYDIQLGFASGDFAGSAGLDLNPVKLSSGVWYKPSGSLLENGTTQGTTIATSYALPSTPATSSGTVYWNGLTSFSEFGGAGGSSPLPVELVSFAGSCEDGVVSLSWQTASEHNSSRFDLEKSRNGSEWQVIQTIPAAGNSNELLTYQAIDHANSEIQYYRLNQVDIDGTNKYYDPIAVDCDETDNEIIQTYPNPSQEGFSIIINNPKNTGDGELTIVDATGTLVSQRSISIQDGVNVFFIKENLTRGIYFIRIENDQHKTKTIKHVVN
jgi:hypothetical protein